MRLHRINDTLKTEFWSKKQSVQTSELLTIHFFDFHSDITYCPSILEGEVTLEERKIIEESGKVQNQKFKYAVIQPNKLLSEDAIFIFHGLNERSWDKYLLWAWYLAQNCGKYVILFPISYHMSRAPERWSNPREMISMVKHRTSKHKHIKNSSFANIALSLRMEHTPEMLPISGIQTYFDIVKLAVSIKSGKHPLLKESANFSFFAYSIGALLAQILLITNPDHLFTHQKAFLFCGGSTFDGMHPSTKTIMDNRAAYYLKEYLLNDPAVANKLTLPVQIAPLLPKAWLTFKSMFSLYQYAEERKLNFSELGNRIHSIGLSKDKVIPPCGIRNTMGQCQELDFSYTYSHENPFPLAQMDSIAEVEKAFRLVFDKAVNFLI